jgi:hypothetical protein
MYFIGSEVKNEGRGRPRLCRTLHRPLDLHRHRVRPCEVDWEGQPVHANSHPFTAGIGGNGIFPSLL